MLDAERDLYLIKRDHAQARYDYLVSTLRLKEAAGMLTSKDSGIDIRPFRLGRFFDGSPITLAPAL